jgi:hypothetical protein
VPPLEQGFMGVSERNIFPEDYRRKAGKTLNETVVKTREVTNIIYSKVCRTYLMLGKSARWGEEREGKFNGVADEKAGCQLMEGGATAAVTCEHGTCTHGTIYTSAEHVLFVVNYCDINMCEMSVLSCHRIVEQSNRLQIGNSGHVNNDLSFCMVPKDLDNTSWWTQYVMDNCQHVLNVSRLQISLIGYDRACSCLASAAIFCGNTVSFIWIYE